MPDKADAPMIDDGLAPPLPQPRTMQLVARPGGARIFAITGAGLVAFPGREMLVLGPAFWSQ
ncbi:hypothetical protein VB636_01345 [Paracoccus sp. APAP_BH8]|uniref:hypothetical protein n=1 Tax=Paracoccus sp. APAP_BH8 TaxID=3110237 RepID=UPI002FD872A7